MAWTKVEEKAVIDAGKLQERKFWPTVRASIPWGELARFTAVGFANTGIDLVVFYLLMALVPPLFNPWVAGAESVAGWMAGTAVGHRLHSRLTFQRALPLWGYYPVALLGMAVQGAVTALLTANFGQWGAMVGKPAGIIMASGLTYLGYRWLALRRSCSLYQTENAGSNLEGFSSKA